MPWQPSYLLRFSFLIISNQQIYLYRARSGFEPESPVHIKTWTWNAGNNGVGGQCHAQDALPTGKRPGAHCLGGWVGPRAGQDEWENLAPPVFDPRNHPARSDS